MPVGQVVRNSPNITLAARVGTKETDYFGKNLSVSERPVGTVVRSTLIQANQANSVS